MATPEGPPSTEDDPDPSDQHSGSGSSAAAPAPDARAGGSRMQMESLMRSLVEANQVPPEDVTDHAFWGSQPVPRMDDPDIGRDEPRGPIAPPEPDKVPKEPLKLPSGFEWASINLNDDAELSELYALLNENYVEDSQAMFRFDYSREFIRWAMMPPGWKQVWHVGVRLATSTRKLVAFIGATPADLVVFGDEIRGVEVNFLCVHKKLRSKRLAPVLIREVTRRCNVEGVWQAAYTAGIVIPKPVGRCQYWHRSLNPKKLIDVGFSQLNPRSTMSRQIKLLKLPAYPQLPGFRELHPADVPQCCRMLNEYLQVAAARGRAPRTHRVPHAPWPLARAAVQVLPAVRRGGVCPLAAAPRGGGILVRSGGPGLRGRHRYGELLQPALLHHRQHQVPGAPRAPPSALRPPAQPLQTRIHPTPLHWQTLFAAYSYYMVPGKASVAALMNDAMIVAAKLRFDVYNALDVQENGPVFKELKFGIGDGKLAYYVYNWRTPHMAPDEVGLILL